VHAQCTFSDSLNKEIPNFIKGNVNQFRIHNEALQSQSLELTAHSYELSLPCTESPDSLLWEFQLELNINTSTNNRFCFGIRQADSSECVFQIGNSKDQLQFIGRTIDTLLGPEQTFNHNKSQLWIQLKKLHNTLQLNLYSWPPQPADRYEITLPDIETTDFFWRIFQNGKTAIGSHRISQLKLVPYPIRTEPFKIKRIHIIRNGLLEIQANQPIELGIVPQIEINHQNTIKIDYGINYHTLLVEYNPIDSDSLHIIITQFLSFYQQNIDTLISIKSHFPKKAQYGDLRFSEVMYDAVPSYGNLPETEYIELHNRKSKWLDLSDLILEVNQKTYPLRDFLPDSTSFMILSPACKEFPNIKCLDIPFNLLNSENTISLKNNSGRLLDSVLLHNKLQDPLFYGGGVSLEAPLNGAPLANSHEWYSHKNQSGSPGKAPIIAPRAVPKSYSPPVTALYQAPYIYFEFAELPQPEQWIYVYCQNKKDSFYYARDPSIGVRVASKSDSCSLSFINRFEEKTNLKIPLYKLNYSPLEITEIHFEADHGADFIEIYNPGKFALSLADIDLLIYDASDKIKHITPCFSAAKNWILPGEFLVFTDNPNYWINQIDSCIPTNILRLSMFPNLSTEGGYIEIVHHLYGRIDKAPFHRNMHTQINALYKSLEKRSAGLPSAYSQSWSSCININAIASPSIGKTPARSAVTTPMVQLPKRRWLLNSPENQLLLYFNFPSEGYYLYISLFDSWGNPLGMIINGLQMPLSGTYPLLLEDFPSIIKSGNYILKFEAFHFGAQHQLRQIERISFLYE